MQLDPVCKRKDSKKLFNPLAFPFNLQRKVKVNTVTPPSKFETRVVVVFSFIINVDNLY